MLRRLTQGFLFLPMAIGCTGLVSAAVTLYLDHATVGQHWIDDVGLLQVDAQGARSVLSTVAGSAMTVLTLVYSMTLLVFTLAASSLGPRLLETFIENRVNQITIGILGAAFLHAIITLYAVSADTSPTFSAGVAILYGIASFFWLAYFVNDVAHRVMIDHQLGKTEKTLRRQVEQMLETTGASPLPSAPEPTDPGVVLLAERSGYVTHVAVGRLLDLALAAEGYLEVLVAPGDFVFEGLPLVRMVDQEVPLDRDTVAACLEIDDSRAPQGDLLFSVHLLVEIATRALSPGINDPYTAISAMDHLSASLNLFLEREEPSPLHLDDSGLPRVRLRVLSADEVLATALDPLRRATQSNVATTLALIAVIERLGKRAPVEHRPALRHHLRLVAQSAEHCLALPEDRRVVAERLWRARGLPPAEIAPQAVPNAVSG
ncbi:MAG: DUF2254 domain-containing protein [Rhodospirillales bacterium]